MFGWFKAKPKGTLVDLRLDRVTASQERALATFSDWANELVTQHRFHITNEPKDGISYNITLLREENETEWLRCRIEARLHVEEDQRDRRVLGTYSELLVDSRYTQDEFGPEVSLIKPFTPANIDNARAAVAKLLAKVRG